jgi:hypothetical protein
VTAGAKTAYNTFKLMTRVMQTHGLRHVLSSALVQHFLYVPGTPQMDASDRPHGAACRGHTLMLH